MGRPKHTGGETKDLQENQNEWYNDSIKPSYINNHPKCKWIEFSNKRKEWQDGLKNKIQQFVASRKHTSAPGQTQAQSEGVEDNTSS